MMNHIIYNSDKSDEARDIKRKWAKLIQQVQTMIMFNNAVVWAPTNKNFND